MSATRRVNKRKQNLIYPTNIDNMNMSSSTMTHIHLAFYTLLFIGTSSAIIITCSSYPLFPFQTANLEWNNAWLMATIVDYYGACLCYCGIILGTEESWVWGILWTLGCCLLGSPVCCIWMLVRLWRNGSSGLRLQNNSRRQYPSID